MGKLKKSWNDFINKASDKQIILFEGNKIQDNLGDSLSENIQRYGEAGALLSISHGSKAETAWPDIAINDEAKRLTEKFQSDLVAYYIFARSAGSWIRSGRMGTFNEVLAKAAHSTASRIIDSPSDVLSYSIIHQNIFNKPLDESQKETVIRASAPVYHDSIINDIARASSRLRNENILIEIEKYWLDGYSIFALFGSAHAVIQECALRDMAGK